MAAVSTTLGSLTAHWALHPEDKVRVLFVDDADSDAPAKRLPNTAIEGFRPGHTAFPPATSLAKARELKPEWAHLWQRVWTEAVKAMSPNMNRGIACGAHYLPVTED